MVWINDISRRALESCTASKSKPTPTAFPHIYTKNHRPLNMRSRDYGA